jgi:hypothetical protein
MEVANVKFLQVMGITINMAPVLSHPINKFLDPVDMTIVSIRGNGQ